MANTYTQIYLHVVFAVKKRESLIPVFAQKRVHAYIASQLNKNQCFCRVVGGIDNHVHLLFSLSPVISLSQLIKDVKASTTKFINESRFTPYQFAWQRGYGAFSCSPSHVKQLEEYIENQHLHHKDISLQDEVKRLCEKYGIEFDERYIFEDV